MGFKIIGNRSEEGEFIASADAWPPEKIAALFDKFNPNRKLRLAREKAALGAVAKDDKKEDDLI